MSCESELLLPNDIIGAKVVEGEIVSEPFDNLVPYVTVVQAALEGEFDQFPLEFAKIVEFRDVVPLVNIFNKL